jgi:hypothetical protein
MLLAMTAASACNDEPLSESGSGDLPMAVQASVSGNRADHAALQEIVNTFDEAWTGGDPVTYAAQYAGAEWVGPNGAVLTDPAAITALYVGIITFGLPGTTRQSTIRSITFLTGTIAVLDIDARVTGFTQLPPGLVPWRPDTLRALEKNILIKRGGEWRIVKHQQTFVNPEVQ